MVTFYPDFCIVQDMDTKRMIGMGKYFDGLYYLIPGQNPYLANHIHHTNNLWHRRLGHPSSAPLLSLAKNNVEIIFDSTHICDICPYVFLDVLVMLPTSHPSISLMSVHVVVFFLVIPLAKRVISCMISSHINFSPHEMSFSMSIFFLTPLPHMPPNLSCRLFIHLPL
jgi:hypothetical protein